MRKIFWVALLGAAVASLGCVVPSLQPLYHEHNLVFDQRLLGPWIEGDDSLWGFEASGTRSYRLTVADDQELSLFDAHLLRLDEHLFLDLFPAQENRERTFRELHLLPLHTFYKVLFQEGSLLLVPLDQDWLEEEVSAGRIRVPHAWSESELLLTASTDELQEMVRILANDGEAFPVDDPEAFVIQLERTSL